MSAALSAPIGHNSLDPAPFITHEVLRERAAPLIQRRDDLLAGCIRWAEHTPDGICNDEQQARTADFVKQLKGWSARFEDFRTEAKKPVLDAGRIIDAFAKDIAQPLQVHIAKIESAMTRYARQRADEERRAREQAARLAAEEAERLAREAATTGNEARMEEALQAEQRAADAETAAESSVADVTRVHGDFGSVASLGKGKVLIEIVDLAKVPAEFLVLNEQMVRAAYKGGRREFPGLKVTQDMRVSVR